LVCVKDADKCKGGGGGGGSGGEGVEGGVRDILILNSY